MAGLQRPANPKIGAVCRNEVLTLKLLHRERFLPDNLIAAVGMLQRSNRVSGKAPCYPECLARHGGRPKVILARTGLVFQTDVQPSALPLPPEGGSVQRYLFEKGVGDYELDSCLRYSSLRAISADLFMIFLLTRTKIT